MNLFKHGQAVLQLELVLSAGFGWMQEISMILHINLGLNSIGVPKRFMLNLLFKMQNRAQQHVTSGTFEEIHFFVCFPVKRVVSE